MNPHWRDGMGSAPYALYRSIIAIYKVFFPLSLSRLELVISAVKLYRPASKDKTRLHLGRDALESCPAGLLVLGLGVLICGQSM